MQEGITGITIALLLQKAGKKCILAEARFCKLDNAEKTWDCPCHGSRFSIDGEMFTAPAGKDPEKIELRDIEK